MDEKSNIFVPGDNTLSIKPPSFGKTNPRVWFIQVESFFRCRRITSQVTMFSFVSTQLPMDIAAEVVDILDPIPADQPYDKLKEAVLKRTSSSDDARLQHLLSGVELGDRTPSQLLRHMRSLAGNIKLDDMILRQLWCKCLPANTNAILSTQEDGTTLEKLAAMADKVHECFFKAASGSVNAVSNDTQSVSLLQTIADRMSQLELTVAAISSRPWQGRRPSRSTSRPRPQCSNDNPDLSGNPTCRFHSRYGHKARNCAPPCTYRQRHNLPQGNAPASQ